MKDRLFNMFSKGINNRASYYSPKEEKKEETVHQK